MSWPFLVAVYGAVPPSVRGVALMMTSALCVVGMNVSVRHVAEELHPFVIGFFRHIIGAALLAPFFLNGAPLRTRRLPLHALRALLNVAAMLAYFLALTLVPLAKVVALSFSAPLVATAGAILLLGERVTPARAFALAVGFSGALIILRPWTVEVGPGSALVLFSAFMWGTTLIVIKLLSRTESPVTITLYASLLQIPFALAAALFYWQWPTLGQLASIAVVALFGAGTQLALSQAFREADATVVLPADFTKLVFAGVAGWVFFAELPESWVWIGGAVVFSGVMLNAWLDRKNRAVAPGGNSPHTPA